jgi:F-box/leucine-rich repeat protein 10/11
VRPRRSPTPPTLHIEPLSPSFSKLRALEPNYNYPATTNNALGYALQSQPRRQNASGPPPARARAQSDYHRGHGRKPSNIDTLAEAALALSPGFVAPTLGHARSNGQSHAHQTYPPSTEPPHKRARSAYFASPQVGQYASRPATSYEGNGWPNGGTTSHATYESRVEEAALLLNFRTGGWTTPSVRSMPSACTSNGQMSRLQRPSTHSLCNTSRLHYFPHSIPNCSPVISRHQISRRHKERAKAQA